MFDPVWGSRDTEVSEISSADDVDLLLEEEVERDETAEHVAIVGFEAAIIYPPIIRWARAQNEPSVAPPGKEMPTVDIPSVGAAATALVPLAQEEDEPQMPVLTAEDSPSSVATSSVSASDETVPRPAKVSHFTASTSTQVVSRKYVSCLMLIFC